MEIHHSNRSQRDRHGDINRLLVANAAYIKGREAHPGFSPFYICLTLVIVGDVSTYDTVDFLHSINYNVKYEYAETRL
ncbi:hypothetical protein KDH_06010 [Dictyobacter sp. S3.2.2.5]|uniref:Uncharacterized protein n=1 Tax=Dictyobacter halimunensis TaxID=3026934 RepID=A0ABQ6FJE3_9CHLR|nr:hypothetical protein KDH_06010 [Dictyobacter sp. S3.2.2.5]